MTKRVRAGLDIGSTTVKLVVLDEHGGVLYSRYRRHRAQLAACAADLLDEAHELLGACEVSLTVCGSGGKPVAEALRCAYVQEVVANSAALMALYPQVNCAIELGGQDAKVIFFEHDAHTGAPLVSDMRMNGSCAGGTGAFIDEIAKLLDVPVEQMNELASTGAARYDISGRCGVFAKTDIQPLLSQGANKADIALSSFHAIAKQVIGGLAQGLELAAPVAFEGGPLAYNPQLIGAFAQRLNLTESEVVIPEHPETIVARGAALCAGNVPEAVCGTEGCAACAATTAQSCDADGHATSFAAYAARLRASASEIAEHGRRGAPLFASEEERTAFTGRHQAQRGSMPHVPADQNLRGYVGIDCGSTTSKGVALSEDGRVLASFYRHNEGDALGAVRQGLSGIADAFAQVGSTFEVLGSCTTGYGEEMLARALGADCHVVETVAHARAALFADPATSFVLDIGGQDMKALFVQEGVVTNIVVNEACSSGCGSFLETLAASLGVRVEDIAGQAFSSPAPADLGSRCTVFMTSSVITAQRDGAQAPDILAGLCRSVIENVFTKVVRVHNMDELGSHIMVQGGTFENLAVVRAMEERVGRQVRVAPHPGLMGAIGAALYAQEHTQPESSFIGFEAARSLACEHENDLTCTGCANACHLRVSRFSNGNLWVSGNRCPRGEEIAARALGCMAPAHAKAAPNLFVQREHMLMAPVHAQPVREAQHQRVGLPRVLELWDSMPFWQAFFSALGYEVVLSDKSSQELYESGLRYVASDTVCLPAKLVHGHVASLCEKGVDRIFLPHVMHMPPEGTDQHSPYVCSILMGYPTVVRNTQNPQAAGSPVFDTPVFHWFTEHDRTRQICAYAREELGATTQEAEKAFEQGKQALIAFRRELREKGDAIRAQVEKEGGFAVVLAGRPYHSDPFVSHGVSQVIAACGVPVLPVDALSDMEQVDLRHARAEITNDFHTRMLEGAAIAACDPHLEYVQLVSFGCGHDAILSDEIARIMRLAADKHPLLLKLDESEAAGSLKIRIRSFLETVRPPALSRIAAGNEATPPAQIALPDPFPVKYAKPDRKRRTLIIPNISEEVSILLEGILASEGYTVETVPLGGVEQIRLGKRYTHNDICFPCQMVIGELLDALERGGWRSRQDEVAVGMVKFQCDCRMSHYAALLRMALDNAGFTGVPVLTTDMVDPKDAHPGVSLLGPGAVLKAVRAFTMLDLLAQIKRRQAPYDEAPGTTQACYLETVRAMAAAVSNGTRAVQRAYEQGIERMARIPLADVDRKPRVLVTGELLVTYHPGSNFQIEQYLESCGMETVFPRFTDQLRKDFLAAMAEVDDFGAKLGYGNHLVTKLFDLFQAKAEKIARRHPLYESEPSPALMYEGVRDVIPKTLSCGEGWLMAAEIDHYAQQDVHSFVILQPFGCLPNHVCGRGVTKRLKERHPGIQILPLDLDPDTSPANVENRLQMLVMQHHVKE